jgi:RNA polymerase sigma-70 factor (ECF subfamily)
MHLEHLFQQFRRTRDPARLGEVFDLCADDLFAVALHLCRDRAAAEDLVQSTFLVAIERAGRYEAGRPLRPWLLGILYREAKRLRRRARVPDAERLLQREEPPPPQVVLGTETAHAVAVALGEVPQPYRAVLELHLVQSLPPADIADRLQRSPGAVRTQLWRGLELLRKLLPKGLAVGVAAELGARPALAAMRARVMEAASAKAAGAGVGIGVLAGGLLMKKVLCAIAVLVGVAAWWQWPAVHEGVAMASPGPSPAVAVVAQPGEGVTPLGAVETTRTPAVKDEPGAATETPPVGTPTVVAAVVPVLVVDGAGDPVPEAEVCVYEGADKTTDRRQSAQPLERIMTNSVGRARVTIRGPSLVSARKQRIGWSGDLRAQRDMQDLRIVLLSTATVRGVVLLPDGKPAAGARVTGYCQPFNQQLTGELAPAVADEAGRFVFEVLAGDDYLLLAARDGRYSERAAVPELKPGGEHEVVLRFPGAYSVRGQLLDVDDHPLAGMVYVVGAERLDHFASNWQTKSDAEGRFEILLAKGGAFDLVGGVEGQTSAHATLVLEEARPHQQITLRTSPFVAVSGKVVDERGEPCPGVHVGLGYVVDRDFLHERRSDLHGILPRGPTAADGTFEFLAPAGYRYQVVCQVIPGNLDIWVRGPAFAAPASGLVVTLRDSDKQGFVVSGCVLAAEGGVAVPEFRISLTTHGTNGCASNHPIGTGVDGRFRVGPLEVGRRYSLEFEADGLARATVGPFDATVREETVTVHMQRCGSVRCRVLRADGTPAVNVLANLQRLGADDPFGRAWQGETDTDGHIEFRDVVPDAYKATRAPRLQKVAKPWETPWFARGS